MDENTDLETEIASSESDRILIRGQDLTENIMGEVDFTSFLYFHYAGKYPTESEVRMLNAILVSIAEHGITPSVIASRLTLHAAPESLQGAVASGLLGAGSVFLGSMQNCGNILQSATPYDDKELTANNLLHETSGRFPGLGHPEHKPNDPRSIRLFEIAKAEGFHGEHVRLMKAIRKEAELRFDQVLPINAAGAIAAVASDMQFDWRLLKGFALISRTAGLVGHLYEEMENPMARDIWNLLLDNVNYTGKHSRG